MRATSRAIGAVVLAALLGVGAGRLYLGPTAPESDSPARHGQAIGYDSISALSAPATRAEEVTLWPQIATCSSRQLRQLAERLPSIHRARAATRQLILQRLAKFDPERALALAGQNDESQLLDAVLLTLAELHPAVAERWVGESSGMRRNERQARWLRALGVVDPPAAFRTAAAERDAFFDHFTLPAARWGHSHPREALAAAEALPERRRTQTIAAVLDAWVQVDRAEAVRWLQQARPLPGHDWLWRRVLLRLGQDHPQEAAELAVAAPDQTGGEETLKAVLYGWAQTDFAAATAWIDARDITSGPKWRRHLVDPWMQQDPAGALAFVLEQKDEELLRSALRAWQRVDLAAARAWLVGLPACETRERALAAWASGTSIDAHDAWLALLEALPPVSESSPLELRQRRTAIRTVAGLDLPLSLRWAAQDRASTLIALQQGHFRFPEIAAAAMHAFQSAGPDDPVWREASISLEEILGHWAQREPLRAARWLADRTLSGRDSEVPARVASEWAKSDPAAAWRWALSLPAGVRESVQEKVLVEWARVNLPEALAMLPPERVEQESLRNLICLAAAEADPAAAAQLATNVSGSQRAWILERIATHWMRRDPRAARPWIEMRKAELPPDRLRWIARIRPDLAFSLLDSRAMHRD